MFRAAFLALPLLLAPVVLTAPSAAAASADHADQSRDRRDCEQRNRRRGRGIGGFLGGIAGGFGGRAGGVANLVTNVLPVGQLLGEAISSLLDCDEQRKAANATEEAVRQGEVGTTATWESETRPGVTGSSTVTTVEAQAVDGECMTVTDVVIIDGEETRAPKRMCRRPPNNRYVRV
jgi:surface antigen